MVIRFDANISGVPSTCLSGAFTVGTLDGRMVIMSYSAPRKLLGGQGCSKGYPAQAHGFGRTAVERVANFRGLFLMGTSRCSYRACF